MTRIRCIALLLIITLVTSVGTGEFYTGIAARPDSEETQTNNAEPEKNEVSDDNEKSEEYSEVAEYANEAEETEKSEEVEKSEESEESEKTEEKLEKETEPSEPVEVTSVTLDKTLLEIKTNETLELSAKCLPSSASDTSIIWITSDSEVAEVSETGEVTGIMEGTAVITAMSSASPWIFETCEVIVSKDFISTILLGRKAVKLSVDSVMPIAVMTMPDTAYDKTFTWACDNEDVAEMLPGNIIKALKPGTATFTATANDYGEDGRPAEAKISVTVITTADYYCTVGKTVSFKASLPSDYPESLIWNVYKLTKDSSVAAGVDEVEIFTNKFACKLFGNAVGEYRIEITDPENDKNTQIIHVNVKEPVKKVVAYLEGDEEKKKIRRTELTLDQNGTNPKTIQLYAAVEPESATYKDVYWKSSKPDLVSVDENGVVTPLGVGSAVITCTSAVDGKKSIFTVNVKYNSSTITLNKTEPITLRSGKSARIKATLDKSRNTSSVVVWESSNPEAVAVKNGKITAVGVGSATITASTTGGNVSASIEVQAVIVPTKVLAERKKLELSPGAKEMISVTLEPSNVSETELVYESRNPAVATVDDSGNITAVGAGTTTVTVKTVNGKRANISVVVR